MTKGAALAIKAEGTAVGDESAPPRGKRRCARCGALSSEAAAWCGQCLERFPSAASAAPLPELIEAPDIGTAEAGSTGGSHVADQPGTEEAGDDPGGLGGADQGGTEGAGEPRYAAGETPPAPLVAPGEVVRRGAVAVTSEGITWSCAVCGSDNPFEARACAVCGATFAATMSGTEDSVPERDPGTTALFSLLMPGAGHAYLGMWGQGVARAVISLWAVSVGLFAGLQGGRGTPMAVLFGVVAFCLWVVAAHDAYREASHDPSAVLLKTKHFLFLVLGLLVLMVLAMVTTAMGAR